MNHYIFLKYDGTNLLWSFTEDGIYTEVGPNSPATDVYDNDTVTYTAMSGIDNLVKIESKPGSPNIIKSQRGDGTLQIVVTIIDKTAPFEGEVDKYNIKFKPTGGGGAITADPEFRPKGNP